MKSIDREMGRTIAVVGLWHLGSVISACWADLGYRVHGIDLSEQVIAGLSGGRAPDVRTGLDELLQSGLDARRLSFGHDVASVIPQCDYVFIAFDTPVDDEDRSNMTPLHEALRAIGPYLKATALVVVSSQVPVGTCSRWRKDLNVELAYSPENLRLGEAIRCYMQPERIVVGAQSEEAHRRAAELFSAIPAPILAMNLPSAEMSKHALNAFLATSVSFINEIADICEVCDADVLSVVSALKSDPRVGQRAFLSAGLGFAGGTLARDIQTLSKVADGAAVTTPLLESALEVNRRRPQWVIARLNRLYGHIDGLTFGVLGLTYKAGTSTLRRSVALEVIQLLIARGATVRAFDPKADLSELAHAPDFEVVSSAVEAGRDASAVIVLTEWPEFRDLDFVLLRSVMKNPVILDGKNHLIGLDLAAKGFQYFGVGR